MSYWDRNKLLWVPMATAGDATIVVLRVALDQPVEIVIHRPYPGQIHDRRTTHDVVDTYKSGYNQILQIRIGKKS